MTDTNTDVEMISDNTQLIERETPFEIQTTNSSIGANETYNASTVPSHRWPCKSFSISNTTKTVIVSNETLFTDILAEMNTTHGCGLLLFYSPYCEFCANLAPLYNAIGRSYPDLAVMALDTQEAMGTAARYGVVGIPTVFFFYSGRPVAKFNQSRTPANFERFVKKLAGYTLEIPLNITKDDMDGPLNTRVMESRDYYMIFSVTFLSLFIGSKIFGKHLWQFVICIVEFVRRKLSEWTTRRVEENKEKED